jgi:hypothetical protein
MPECDNQTTIGRIQIKMRLLWWDAICGTLGHQWKQRGENAFAKECQRCHRQQLMMMDKKTGTTNWIITP